MVSWCVGSSRCIAGPEAKAEDPLHQGRQKPHPVIGGFASEREKRLASDAGGALSFEKLHALRMALCHINVSARSAQRLSPLGISMELSSSRVSSGAILPNQCFSDRHQSTSLQLYARPSRGDIVS